MDKKLLLFVLVANNCFGAAADETAAFFRIAEREQQATKTIVDYLRHISQTPETRIKMGFVGEQNGWHFDSSINVSTYNGDEDVGKLSGTVRVINKGEVGGLRVKSKLVAAQKVYDMFLQSDSFTVSSVFGELPQCGAVGVECTTIVPKAAYLRIIREGEAAAPVEDAEPAG